VYVLIVVNNYQKSSNNFQVQRPFDAVNLYISSITRILSPNITSLVKQLSIFDQCDWNPGKHLNAGMEEGANKKTYEVHNET
jgi:hypothetical protein